MISKIVKTIILIFTVFGLSYGIVSNQPLIDSSSLFRTSLMHTLYIILSLYLMYNFYKKEEKIPAILTLIIFILLIIYIFLPYQLMSKISISGIWHTYNLDNKRFLNGITQTLSKIVLTFLFSGGLTFFIFQALKNKYITSICIIF